MLQAKSLLNPPRGKLPAAQLHEVGQLGSLSAEFEAESDVRLAETS